MSAVSPDTLLAQAGWVPWAAAGVAAVAALVLRAAASRLARRDRERLADGAVLASVSPPPSRPGRVIRLVLLALGSGSLAAVLAGAGSSGIRSEEVTPGSLETVLVLDASNSMLAEDVAPSRAAQQRAIARRLVAEIDGRFGVVYFSGGGYVLSPLTEDRGAALMFAESVDPSLVGRGGTSLPAGLVQGLAVLGGGAPGAPRAMLLLSDGESTVETDELDAVLASAEAAGVPIHVVGFGTAEGGRIPMPVRRIGDPLESAERAVPRPDPGAGGRSWLRDAEGQPVVSRLEESVLRRVAAATGGLYVPAGDEGVDALVRRLPGGNRRSASGTAVLALLLIAFAALFAEAYLFRRA